MEIECTLENSLDNDEISDLYNKFIGDITSPYYACYAGMKIPTYEEFIDSFES